LRITRVFDLTEFLSRKFNDRICFSQKKNDEWLNYSFTDYKNYSDKISIYLLFNKIKKGDKIITLLENSAEWNFFDIGIMQAGAIHIAVFPLISDEQLDYILKQTKPKIIFVSYLFLFKKMISYYNDKKTSPKIVIIDSDEFSKSIDSLNIENLKLHDKLFNIKSKILPADIASIIYTSSSAGFPKGAVHTHKSIVSCFTKTAKLYLLGGCDKALVTLPLSLSYPRWANYLFQYCGLSVYYGDKANSVIRTVMDIKPDVIALVPFILNNIFEFYCELKNKHNDLILKTLLGKFLKKIICSGSALP
jgi:long-chain acyl-CoA synthetase